MTLSVGSQPVQPPPSEKKEADFKEEFDKKIGQITEQIKYLESEKQGKEDAAQKKVLRVISKNVDSIDKNYNGIQEKINGVSKKIKEILDDVPDNFREAGDKKLAVDTGVAVEWMYQKIGRLRGQLETIKGVHDQITASIQTTQEAIESTKDLLLEMRP